MTALRIVLAAALATSLRAQGAAAPIVVHVYHTNDVHGWIMPRPDKGLRADRLVGGAAALKTLDMATWPSACRSRCWRLAWQAPGGHFVAERRGRRRGSTIAADDREVSAQP